MIIGGSKITYYLAKKLLEENSEVKIIEVDENRAHELSEVLPKATVIIGNGSDQNLLLKKGLKNGCRRDPDRFG